MVMRLPYYSYPVAKWYCIPYWMAGVPPPPFKTHPPAPFLPIFCPFILFYPFLTSKMLYKYEMNSIWYHNLDLYFLIFITQIWSLKPTLIVYSFIIVKYHIICFNALCWKFAIMYTCQLFLGEGLYKYLCFRSNPSLYHYLSHIAKICLN